MKNKTNVLKEISKRYNLTKELLVVRHEYTGTMKCSWYAMIVEDLESNTTYLTLWNEYTKINEIEIKQYTLPNSYKALSDLCEYIIA